MKFTTALPVAVALAASVWSVPVKRDVDPSLIPQFGHAAGVNPTGTGNCDGAVNGANGKPIAVPCTCPPDRNTFIQSLNANVQAGHAVHNPSVAVSFPTDDSEASQEARLGTAIVTLQNLNGPGQGCPASSTTFGAQQKAIQNGQSPAQSPASAPAPAPAPAAAAPAAAAAASPAAVAAAPPPVAPASSSNIASLIPSLGFTAGKNPTGTGNCDGAVNGANGKPIAVPCSCPPAQAAFNTALEANVNAGHAVNNPSVSVSFPTDGSKQSQAARIQAAIVTLQNLNGPGQGCPAASTTLSAQLAAAQQ